MRSPCAVRVASSRGLTYDAPLKRRARHLKLNMGVLARVLIRANRVLQGRGLDWALRADPCAIEQDRSMVWRRQFGSKAGFVRERFSSKHLLNAWRDEAIGAGFPIL